MSSSPSLAPSPPSVTWAGLREGVEGSLPMVPGFTVFAIAVGALSVDKGLTVTEALAMSGLVYAGAAQLLALQAWQAHWDAAAVFAAAVVVFSVNLRFVLMAAVLRPFYAPLPPWLAYSGLATLTDASFVLATRAEREGRSSFGVFLGAGVFLWVMWVLSTWIGCRLGHALGDPKCLGLDMVMPIIFIASLVPMVRGGRNLAVLPLAALVALATSYLVDGFWFITVGALAGSAFAALRARPEEDQR